MAHSGQKLPFTGGPNSWLPEEYFLKIHLEITLLTNQAGIPWEDSEEIAGECLIALWIEYERTNFPYPIKPFLSTRMASLIGDYRQRTQLQREAETWYITTEKIEMTSDKNYYRRLTLIRDELLPLLETEERVILLLLLLLGMDLPAIAVSLDYPLSKVRKYYKHGIFRLQKYLGLWKKV